jgi:hypothetical protein
MQSLEPETEALLLRLVPNLADQWQGATPDEIERIERLVPGPLPSFYRWFLGKMGRSMGALAYPTIDFSADRVLWANNDEEPQVAASKRFFLVGYETDEHMQLHVFYDLSHPLRDDARVVRRHALGGTLHVHSETFREMLVWGKFLKFRIHALPQRCSGSFEDEGCEVFAHLDPVMERLGFKQPLVTGANCRLFEREDAAMECSSTPSDNPRKYQFFTLGGGNVSELRRILGTITTESALKLRIDEWFPPIL